MKLFLGIPIPEPFHADLEALKEEKHNRIQWVPPANFHLTLKYLGEVASHQVDTFYDRLSQVSVKPFPLTIGGVGRFPENTKKEPHVIWAGLEKGHPHLFQLHKDIDYTMSKLGIYPDARVYVPHITLGRCKVKSEEQVRQWLKAHEDFASGTFDVSFFTLYESQASLKGIRYRPIYTLSLGAIMPGRAGKNG